MAAWEQSRDIKRRILEFIRRYRMTHQHGPRYTEIAAGVGLQSESAVTYHLYDLRAKGFVDWEDGKARTVRITECEPAPRVAAGVG